MSFILNIFYQIMRSLIYLVYSSLISLKNLCTEKTLPWVLNINNKLYFVIDLALSYTISGVFFYIFFSYTHLV